jgi:tRNA threonylcarbamoyladenosine dehydratase
MPIEAADSASKNRSLDEPRSIDEHGSRADDNRPSGADDSRRFGGVSRLYGDDGLARIRASHVVVVGIGGVGSWIAEALARSGVGTVTLIDLDVVAESNLNRQVHATIANLGRNKVDAMCERIHAFASDCNVRTIDDFVTPENVATIVPRDASIVIDAIDNVRAKAALIAHCKLQRQAIVVCGGAGGKLDPTRIRSADLTQTKQDPLLSKVRATLRKDYAFPRGEKKFGVIAIYSEEPPAQAPIDGGAGLACAGYGSAMHMTATLGLTAVSLALSLLASTKHLRTL